MTELREWSGNERKGKINKLKTQQDEWQRERDMISGTLTTKVKNASLPHSVSSSSLSLSLISLLFIQFSYFQHPPTVSALMLLNIIPFLSLSIAPQCAVVGETGEGSVAPLMQRITGREGREEKRFPCWPCPAAKLWMAMVMLVQRGGGYEQEKVWSEK